MRHLKRHLLLATGAAATTVCAAFAAATALGNPPIGAYTTKGAWTFVSNPKLHPPKYHTDAPTKFSQLAPGYFFVANFPNLTATQPAMGKGATMVGQSGPYIVDDHLQPVWFHSVGTQQVALDLKLEKYSGKSVLSWWQGTVTNAGVFTSGKVVVDDQHYNTVGTIPKTGNSPSTATGGWTISGHDAVISGNNMWVTAYMHVAAALCTGSTTPVNLLDSGIQEYNLKTGVLEGTWDACHHIPLSESQQPPPSNPSFPWDAYHVNSVQLLGNKFLTSMRNTWGAYLVDTSSTPAALDTSPIQWTLGGNNSSFKVGKNAHFQWQHHVVLHPKNVVSIFDDGCCEFTGTGFAAPNGPTRGLVLQLSFSKATHPKPTTAKLVKAYPHTPPIQTFFLGSTQLLPNGNVLVGWGSGPFFSEYSNSGTQLMDVSLPFPDLTYRAFVHQWVGTPGYPPRGASRKHNGKTTVYASWNGATQVASWRVLGGSDGAHLKQVATAPKNGFETAIGLSSGHNAYEVQALDAKGHVLGTSKLFGPIVGQIPQGY